ncbi:MAG: trypsin-like serine peptidase [Planctomycetota bacterium]|jgi:hypothetical protein
MRTRAAVGIGLFTSVFVTVAEVSAQPAPLAQYEAAVSLDSGLVVNAADQPAVIFDGVVEVPGALWLRLIFDQAALGADPQTGREATLRLTSLADGAVQHHTAATLQQWRDTSAYFNGDAVRVEIVADPGVGASRVTITHVLAGLLGGGMTTTICGPTDDRLPSEDARVARAIPIGCTAWLIDDAANCFITAGHCAGSSMQVAEFNVPFSNSGGGLNHPGPEDQYAVDVSSKQTMSSGVGQDWAYFGCYPNTETGLTAAEAQGAWFTLAESPPPVSGQNIRITGHGTDNSPPEWNQVQQTHAGPYVTFAGTTVQYRTDTTGGNSGSPVINEDTGQAIGVHTHGGCNSSGGQNSGTGSNHPSWHDALADPQGVCIPVASLSFNFPDGLPAAIHPEGDVVRVEVSGQGGGTPRPDSGVLYLANDGPFVPITMVEVTTNVYDAVFPAMDCGSVAQYYFSAETTDDQVVYNPLFAPDESYGTVIAIDQQTPFHDDFETHQFWTVYKNETLTTGEWQRGAPAGGGDLGDPPTDADGSGLCYVTQNINGNYDVDNGYTILMSPLLDASEGVPVISYWRWFSNSSGANPFEDTLLVEVSGDRASTWTTLETVGPTGPEVSGGWFRKAFRITDFVPQSDEFVIRFTASDVGGESVVEAGVDGVRLYWLDCGAVPGDLDGDGLVGVTDFLILLAEWGPCDDPCPPYCLGDIDEDCTVGVTDFLALLANWS